MVEFGGMAAIYKWGREREGKEGGGRRYSASSMLIKSNSSHVA